MNKPRILLFDIDYTLFNSLKFRKRIVAELGKLLKESKIKNLKKSLDKIYFKSRRDVGYFNPSSFISDINRKFNSKIPKDFLDIYVKKEELHEHLYEEVEEILQKLSQNRKLIIGIFSGGNENFQIEKIKKLQSFFHKDHIHIFPYKINNLQSVLKKYKNYEVFLIDDVLPILYKAKKLDKNVYTIWIKRGRFAYSEKELKNFTPDKKIKNLKEIISLVL